MALIIRNRNRYINSIKSKVRRYIYSNHFMLKNYLNLKEFFIKSNSFSSINEDMLFEKVFIETISYCNNDCVFCPASNKIEAKNPEHLMSEDLYVKILNELADISFSGSLAFHCNNEPLLDERLSSWVKKARALLKNNFFYLYTNAILIDVKLTNQLFDAGLNRIIINNYNDKYELFPSLERLIDNSSILQGEVIINYRFKTEYWGNRAGENPSATSFLKEPLKIICIRPLKEIVIGYDGTIPLCCSDGLWKVIMGNVKKSSLNDIWFSDGFKRVRESLVKGNRNCTEICKMCDTLNFSAPKGIKVYGKK